MKTVEIFYLPGCPYCVKAKRAIGELKEEQDSYERVPLKWIDEAEEVDYANEHDYYYVPSVYYNGKKIFEAHPGDSMTKIKEGIRTAFDKAVFDGPGDDYIASFQSKSV